MTYLRPDALTLQDAVHAAHAEPGASNQSQGVPGKHSVESDVELRLKQGYRISTSHHLVRLSPFGCKTISFCRVSGAMCTKPPRSANV